MARSATMIVARGRGRPGPAARGKTARMTRALLALFFALPLHACGDDGPPDLCRDSPLTDNPDRMWTPCSCEDSRGDETRPDWRDGCNAQADCYHSGTQSLCTRDCSPTVDDCPPAFGRRTVCTGKCELPCGNAAAQLALAEDCPVDMVCEANRYCIFEMGEP